MVKLASVKWEPTGEKEITGDGFIDRTRGCELARGSMSMFNLNGNHWAENYNPVKLQIDGETDFAREGNKSPGKTRKNKSGKEKQNRGNEKKKKSAVKTKKHRAVIIKAVLPGQMKGNSLQTQSQGPEINLVGFLGLTWYVAVSLTFCIILMNIIIILVTSRLWRHTFYVHIYYLLV